MPTQPQAPDRLLVRLPNPLGDALMATPLLAAVAEAWPQLELVLAGRPAHAELLRELPGVVAYLELSATLRVGEEADILHQAQASHALVLPNSWSSALATWRARIPHRLGRRRHGRGLLFTASLPRIRAPRPMPELYLDMLNLFGLPRPEHKLRLMVQSPGAPQTPLPETGRLLAVAPGAAYGPSKLLPTATLLDTLRLLHDRGGWIPVLLGSPQEAGMLEALAKALDRPHVLPQAEQLSLRESSALLAHCHAFFGNDSGTRHLAAAHELKQVVWYGPTNPRWSAYDLDRLHAVRLDALACLGCQQPHCPLPDHPCMRDLEPETLAAPLLP